MNNTKASTFSRPMMADAFFSRLHARNLFFVIAAYFGILLILAPDNVLSLDTYYYWEWSRHLALSYYDGSPMIAYFIRLSTWLFGDTLFALNLVGIFVAASTCIILYKTARWFLSVRASCVAVAAWLFSPLVTMDILTQTTYDAPLTIFWALTVYYTVKFMHTNKTSALYLIGINMGLMMLSKYTGIVLILSLGIFLLFSPYRTLLKNKHFYLALLLSTLIFSPVILWNYQNQWLSFSYQLNSHHLDHNIYPLHNIVRVFFTMFLPYLNIMLLFPFLNTEPDNQSIRLCRIICLGFLGFYFYASINTEIRVSWLAPYILSSSLLFGYFFEKLDFKRIFSVFVCLYAAISLFVFIDNTSKYTVIPSKKMASYQLIQNLNQLLPTLSGTIFTSGWFEARMMFFLNHKPAIYTLGCTTDQNQYVFWSKDMQKQIADKTLKEALYLDSYERKDCLDRYFDQCSIITTLKMKKYSLFAYRCINH